jgi:hypothetical protein
MLVRAVNTVDTVGIVGIVGIIADIANIADAASAAPVATGREPCRCIGGLGLCEQEVDSGLQASTSG